MGHYAIGLDFGTNSVRALIVDVRDGRELAESVWNYAHGERGIVLDEKLPDLARQHPQDYIDGTEATIKDALAKAAKDSAFKASDVIGIGVDTTGSTPLPVDVDGVALALKPEYRENPDAMAWLWKDHTAYAEADQLTALAEKSKPEYLAKCGGRYSSEWFWSKILRASRVAPKVFDAAYTWVEIADWIPAILAGTTHPSKLKRGICAAGHKAFYHTSWGGYPAASFLAQLEPKLERVRKNLPDKVYAVDEPAGVLTEEWAKKLGLSAGIPIAVGAFDAHLGAVGAGVKPGTLVKIMGTSTCDVMVSPGHKDLGNIPGLCGIVPGSVTPGQIGLEAGQSAVGDIFNWFVQVIEPGKGGLDHALLNDQASKLKPGESGLLALDWMNGNRTILVDQRLTGTILGLTLHTSPADIYRALIEATAFGARVIMERFEEYGVKVERVINCGGIAARSPLTMQIYADIMNRPLAISKSTQTCALGSAMAGAVVAGKEKGGYASFGEAIDKMSAVLPKLYEPNPAAVKVYQRLYILYRQLHDAFGVAGTKSDVSNVMKDLLDIRDEANK